MYILWLVNSACSEILSYTAKIEDRVILNLKFQEMNPMSLSLKILEAIRILETWQWSPQVTFM